MARDWHEWHRAYDDANTPLRQRLAIVQERIRHGIDTAPAGLVRVISICAGDGRDLLGVLTDHARRDDVRARLVELDPQLAKTARTRAPAGVDIVCGDASTTSAFEGATPAHVALLCGVFGNITDRDIERTIRALPSLCAPSAHVVWTRHRRPPDRTVEIRRWFSECGFEQVAFDAPEGFFFGVGLHRLAAEPRPFRRGVKLFEFVGSDLLG